MMAARSKMIDNLIQQNANKLDDSHLIFDDPVLREGLERDVEKLESLLNYNSNLEQAFHKLNKKVEGIEALDDLKNKFEDVYDVVI